MQLSSTDYGNFLANEPLPLSTATIADKATEKLVSEFHYLRTNAVEPLATFMDYITYAYMIDNVILLTLGTLHERDTHELLERCHPLGVFDTMPALCVATNVEELYHSVLVETPLGESNDVQSHSTRLSISHVVESRTPGPRARCILHVLPRDGLRTILAPPRYNAVSPTYFSLTPQHHTSATASPRRTSTTSTSRSSGTLCTKPISKTSTHSARPCPRPPTRSCPVFSRLKPTVVP